MGDCCIADAARAPKTSPSSSELLASRLAPWTPVQATSPAANSPASDVLPFVGFDPTHDVVRSRTDRNGIEGEIEAKTPTHFRDRGKAGVYERGVQVGQRQEHCPAGLLDFTGDAAGHHISRRQIPVGVMPIMNGSPRSLISLAPSPLKASEIRNRGASVRLSAVGWN